MTRGILNDLTGKQFGQLKVIARVASDKQGNAQWSCECGCGNRVVVRGSFLRKRQVYCSRRCKLFAESLRVNIQDQRFGRLVALQYVRQRDKSRKAIWRFMCDCGAVIERLADNVMHGDISSCGCLGIESRLKHGQSQTREYHREAYRKWAAANPGKVIENAYKRKECFVLRVPKWLTEEQKAQIDECYREAHRLTHITGQIHHVDHIVPLRGKQVSGLHVPWNLRVMKAEENLRKAHRLLDDIC